MFAAQTVKRSFRKKPVFASIVGANSLRSLHFRSFELRANTAVQGTLRDKASRSAPDLERWAS